MELTQEDKDKLINARLKEYQLKLFVCQMNYEALQAIGNQEGMESTAKQMEALQKAYEAIKGMA